MNGTPNFSTDPAGHGELQIVPNTIARIRKDVVKELNKTYALGYEPYAFTQTIDEGTVFGLRTPKGRFRRTAPILTKILGRSAEFILVPEWRATNGSIHYHGVIFIRDRIKWLKSTLSQLKDQGFVLIKKIDNMDKWVDYFVKEAHIAEDILGVKMPIVSQVNYRAQTLTFDIIKALEEENVNSLLLPPTTKAVDTMDLTVGEA